VSRRARSASFRRTADSTYHVAMSRPLSPSADLFKNQVFVLGGGRAQLFGLQPGLKKKPVGLQE
jgi:hypothetical protein